MGNLLSAFSSAVTPLGAAISAGSSLYNLFTNNSRNKENMRFQSQENEKNRAFNREMAQLAYQRNLEQWERENAYNDPSAVRQRLASAGLNPDLVYGGGASNMASAASPQMLPASSPNGVSPSSSPAPSVGNPASDALTMAQVDVLKSQADKNRADAGKATTEETVIKDLADNSIRVGDATIAMDKALSEQILANTDLINKSVVPLVQKLEAEVSLLKANAENVKASTANINADTAIKKLDKAFSEKTFDVRVKMIAAQYNKTVAEVRSMLGYLSISQMLAPEQLSQLQNTNKNLVWDTWVKRSQLNGIRIHNNQMIFDLESDKDFKNWERGANMFKTIVGTSADAVTAVKGGFNLHLGNLGSGSSRNFRPWY